MKSLYNTNDKQKMTEKEGDIIQWKHFDDHLRQFGA
jgi:hypothetical protein